MQIIGFQTDIAWEDPATNFDRIESLVAAESIESGSLLVFPELSTVGFSMNSVQMVESGECDSMAYFAGLAARLDCWVLAGIPRRLPHFGGIGNTATFFSREGLEVKYYRKCRPFSPAGEAEAYRSGEASLVLPVEDWQVSPFICYDLRFPELFRDASHRGAELMVVIANWPTARVDHWHTLLQARAIENQAYVVGINRAGRDPQVAYPGASLIVDPLGEVLSRAGSGVEVIRAVLDRHRLVEWRSQFPALSEWQSTPHASLVV